MRILAAERAFAIAFSVVVASFLAGAMLVRGWPVSAQIFATAQAGLGLDQTAADDIADAKLAVALERDRPFALGLFGNSRILPVSAADLAGDDGFNFAVPGQSLRQSLAMIEALAKAGRLPARIVIAMDHVELGLPGDVPVTPRGPRRWLDRLSEGAAVSRAASPVAAAKYLVNAALLEGRSAMLAFNPTYLFAKLRVLGMWCWRDNSTRRRTGWPAVTIRALLGVVGQVAAKVRVRSGAAAKAVSTSPMASFSGMGRTW